jgi:Xaa-Pro dipeptidase
LSIFIFIYRLNMYQLGDKALKVSMQLFVKNRQRLVDQLKKAKELPKSSIVILEGGKAELRHCTDHENLFRQASFDNHTADS